MVATKPQKKKAPDKSEAFKLVEAEGVEPSSENHQPMGLHV